MKGYKVVRVREDLFRVLKAHAQEKKIKEYAVMDEIVEIGLTSKRLLPPKSQKERAA